MHSESLEKAPNELRSQYKILEDDFNAVEEELGRLMSASEELDSLLKSEIGCDKAQSTGECPKVRFISYVINIILNF